MAQALTNKITELWTWNKFVTHFLEKHLLLINRQALHLLAEFRNRVKIVSKDNPLMREGKL